MSINESITDYAEALANAGAGPVLEDSEYLYPPAKWATREGRMLTGTELLNECNYWRARCEVLKTEVGALLDVTADRNKWRREAGMRALTITELRQQVADLEGTQGQWREPLKALVRFTKRAMAGMYFCPFCDRSRGFQDTNDLELPETHTLACPWRTAAALIGGLGEDE